MTVAQLLDKAAEDGDLAVARTWAALSWQRVLTWPEFAKEMGTRGWTLGRLAEAVHDAEGMLLL